MAIRIKSRSGESTEQMMRRFKKLCEKEGLTKDIKRKEFYEKPSERRRRAARKSINRRLKAEAIAAGILPPPVAGPGGRPRH
jgi:small subunit ribosomal protein S21